MSDPIETTETQAAPGPSGLATGLVLGLVTVATLIPWLAARDMDERSEGRVPLVAWDIATHGRLFPTYMLGEPYVNKPPLAHSLSAALAGITGRTDLWLMRLASVLTATVCVWLTARLGRRLGGPLAGLASGLFLLASFRFFTQARSTELEILLTTLATAGYLALSGPFLFDVRGAGPWVVASLSVGLMTWTKGPVLALLFPISFMLGCSVARRRAPWTHWRGTVALVVTAVAFALLWAWPVARALGSWGALIDRLTMANVEHRRGPLYYLEKLPEGLLPAGLLLPWMILGWRRLLPPVRAAALTGILGLIVFSVSRSKQSHYLLPFYPLFAVWGGTTAVRVLAGRLRTAAVFVAGLGVAVAAVTWGISAMAPGADPAAPLVPSAVTSLTLAVAAVVILHRIGRRTELTAAGLIVLGLPLVSDCLFADAGVASAVAPYRSVAPIMRALAPQVGDAPFASLDANPAVAFALGRPDLRIIPPDGAASFLDGTPGALLLFEGTAAEVPTSLRDFPIRATAAAVDGEPSYLLLGSRIRPR